jgi:hypothetical protein
VLLKLTSEVRTLDDMAMRELLGFAVIHTSSLLFYELFLCSYWQLCPSVFNYVNINVYRAHDGGIR